MIIDGKAIAEEIYVALKKEREALPRPPRLGIAVGVEDPVTGAYVRLKERVASRLGVEIHKESLPSDNTARAIAIIQDLSRAVDGLVVQLPLPPALDMSALLTAIPPAQDVDALNPAVKEFQRLVHAPVGEAIGEILTRVNADVRDKVAVVVGEGKLVGLPAADLLRRRGAKVRTITLGQGTFADINTADVVVLGAGSPGLIKPEMLKQGVILIDAGTSEQGGKVVGDADPRCAEVASVFTPVPGGVGPVVVAMLFKNLFMLVKRQ